MILQFTNKQIFFSLESIWTQLDYRFKTHINQLVTTNSDEDFIQNITVDVPTLMQCYKAMSSGAYGCTTDMAEILLDSLRDQLLAEANIGEYLTYIGSLETEIPLPEVIPNEQTLALLQVNEYKIQDKATETAKILNGKTQILA